MKSEDLATILERGLAKDPHYESAMEVARKNSFGKLWLVGGMVYRTLAAELYGVSGGGADVDFMTEWIQRPIFFPPNGVRLSQTTFGNPRFYLAGVQLDLYPLHGAVCEEDKSKDLSLPEMLSSYFCDVPLNIQALVYDVDEKVLLGERGIEAIRKREIGINNLYSVIKTITRRHISLRDYLSSKAGNIGFAMKLP